MYASLKGWMNVTAVRKPFSSLSGTGTRTFGAPMDFLCYPTSKLTTVTTAGGEEVISTTQLHVDGNLEFDQLDNIVFEGVERPLATVVTFYRDGVADLKVLYL